MNLVKDRFAIIAHPTNHSGRKCCNILFGQTAARQERSMLRLAYNTIKYSSTVFHSCFSPTLIVQSVLKLLLFKASCIAGCILCEKKKHAFAITGVGKYTSACKKVFFINVPYTLNIQLLYLRFPWDQFAFPKTLIYLLFLFIFVLFFPRPYFYGVRIHNYYLIKRLYGLVGPHYQKF